MEFTRRALELELNDECKAGDSSNSLAPESLGRKVQKQKSRQAETVQAYPALRERTKVQSLLEKCRDAPKTDYLKANLKALRRAKQAQKFDAVNEVLQYQLNGLKHKRSRPRDIASDIGRLHKKQKTTGGVFSEKDFTNWAKDLKQFATTK